MVISKSVVIGLPARRCRARVVDHACDLERALAICCDDEFVILAAAGALAEREAPLSDEMLDGGLLEDETKETDERGFEDDLDHSSLLDCQAPHAAASARG